MTAARTYLDYNASAPLRPAAREAMLRVLECTGNASSVHAEGRQARAAIENARADVAALVGATPRDVIFTSGATEAANWVLRQPWRHVVVSAVEHPCITVPLERAGVGVTIMPVDSSGQIDVAGLEQTLDRVSANGQADTSDTLLAVQHANNESGIVQPIAAIADLARAKGVRMLVDAVQAAGRIPIDVRAWGVNYLIVSSHKIGGPQGAGALVLGHNVSLAPLLSGGGQERGLRAGTENIAAIAGFGAASRCALDDLGRIAEVAALRDALEAGLARATPGLEVIGANVTRLVNTSLVALRGTLAETVLIALDLAGFAVSAGAACHSGKTTRSPVLAAMGLNDDIARSAVRFSLGWATRQEDINATLGAWQRVTRMRDGERHVA